MNNMKSGFVPKRCKNFGREKESTNNVKNMMKFSFRSTILLRGTQTSYLMNSAIGMQNSLENILSVFKRIIRSKYFDSFGKLSFNNFCKIKIYLQQLRTMFHMKNPAIAGIIINKDNKISRSTNTRDRGRPLDIRINQVKDSNGH